MGRLKIERDPLTRTVEEEIDSIVAEHAFTARFSRVDTTEWTASFEARLPFRLPPSFLALIRRYRFSPFECAGAAVFGNVDGTQRDDLAVAVFRDSSISSTTHRHGLVQIGRPDSGSYDPICFDFRTRTKSGEAPLVRLDHEQILMNGKIKIVGDIETSFLQFFARLNA